MARVDICPIGRSQPKEVNRRIVRHPFFREMQRTLRGTMKAIGSIEDPWTL